jgi:hypothetical protein
VLHRRARATRHVPHRHREVVSTSAPAAESGDSAHRRALLGDVSMTQQAFDAALKNPKNSSTFLRAEG